MNVVMKGGSQLAAGLCRGSKYLHGKHTVAPFTVVHGRTSTSSSARWKNTQATADWGYEGETGPASWLTRFVGPSVTGQHQSPVHVTSRDAEHLEGLQADPWRFWQHHEGDATVHNTGASVQVDFAGRHYFCGGGLPSLYRFEQYHFHWGGAEHTLNGRQHTCELHIVGYDAVRFSSFKEAAAQHDGLAVLGVLYEEGEENAVLNPIIETLHQIQVPKRIGGAVATAVSSPSLQQLLPGNTTRFYRYGGSLTTPPLHESVLWTIFHDTLSISQRQLSEFKALRSAGGDTCLAHNCRPPQPLCGRTVYKSFTD